MTPELETAAQVLGELGKVLEGLPLGKLTDDERQALGTAEAVLKVSEALARESGDPTAVAVMAILNAFPVSAIARLAVTWRTVRTHADHLAVDVGSLGPGVTFS